MFCKSFYVYLCLTFFVLCGFVVIGLKIRPFKQCHLNRETDAELLHLSEYLEMIATRESKLSHLDHGKWEKYVKKNRGKPVQTESEEGKSQAEGSGSTEKRSDRSRSPRGN